METRRRYADDFAVFFIKNNAGITPDTPDGNARLQAMLVLAGMAHMALHKKQLFDDEVVASADGFAVEKIRQEYRDGCFSPMADSEKPAPNFTGEEYETLTAVAGTYGHLSTKQLSGIIHSFHSWQQAYQDDAGDSAYYGRKKPALDFAAFPEDIEAVGRAIKAYRETKKDAAKYKVINGVTFFCNGMAINDAIISELEKFSLVCEEDSYTICEEDGRLVFY